MADKQIRVVVSAKGVFRRLLGITERPEGSVYVRLYSGMNLGINVDLNGFDAEIKEHRFSLHPSPDLEYSVMNRHTLLNNGKESKLASRVLAIKAGAGFSPVFFCRYTDLTHPVHDIKTSKSKKASHLFGRDFNYDHNSSTISLGLYVASVNERFAPQVAGRVYKEWIFDKMKVLVLAGFSNFPATPFAQVGQPVGTIMHPDGSPQISAPLSSDECENLFDVAAHKLLLSQFQELLSLDMPDETRASLQWGLSRVMPPPQSKFNLIGVQAAAPKKQDSLD